MSIGRRNEFRHIRIDIIGGCAKTKEMQNACPRFECDEGQFINRYPFFMALENSNCKDYVTEKYWDRFQQLSVPIVMRRAIYEGLVPNG